jgi:hypothetical protein
MTVLCENNIDLDSMVTLGVIFRPGPGDAVQHGRSVANGDVRAERS